MECTMDPSGLFNLFHKLISNLRDPLIMLNASPPWNLCIIGYQRWINYYTFEGYKHSQFSNPAVLPSLCEKLPIGH